MALNIADLSQRTVKHTFDFDGTPVTIELQPHKMTPTYMATLERGQTAEDGDEESRTGDARICAEILVNWDVEMDGHPYPPTYENLVAAPSTLVTRTAYEIVGIVGKLAAPARSRK